MITLLDSEVIATGFEPVTVCLEGRCSIQLSYATLAVKNKPHALEKGTFHKPTELHLMSGWQDSNLRPPAPKAGAITGLRYTPKRCANIHYALLIHKTSRREFSASFLKAASP